MSSFLCIFKKNKPVKPSKQQKSRIAEYTEIFRQPAVRPYLGLIADVFVVSRNAPAKRMLLFYAETKNDVNIPFALCSSHTRHFQFA
jgi:hypothetical protein